MSSPIMKHVDSFEVTGLNATTKNIDEFNQDTAKIPKLWQQFYSNHFMPNAIIYGVYSNYESDANGLYTVTVGTSNTTQDKKLNTIKVNAGNYLIFGGKGPMPQTVIETWKQVWNYFSENSHHQRCFLTDFEMYENENEVAIYIGVK